MIGRSMAALAVAILSLPALAQEQVDLKARYKEGESTDVRTQMRMNMGGTVQGMNVSIKQETTKAYREKTLSVDAGRPVRVERTYTTHEQMGEQKMGDMPPQTMSEKNPLVGMKLVLVSKDGAVEIENPPEEGELEEDDLKLGMDFDKILPVDPIAVGSEWKITREAMEAFMGKDAPKKCEGTCKLEEVVEKDGAKVARVAMKVTVEGEEEGMKFSGDLTGPLLFDITAGRPVSFALKGPVKMSMPMATLEGKMEVEGSVTPAK